ncbi:MAG: RHS repeat-associated core domain-containing protein, partial [Verrucomicrobiae bacterium]|nr:RHS repeat-associated core domain-containing protein [Verrucomicrobiae bacterium]
ARYQYDPYGNLLGMAGPLAEANTYRFSSKEWHANAGLYYYGFRFYEPNLQRWPNQDPIGEQGGLNLYRFVRNNPINGIDPLGLADSPALMFFFCPATQGTDHGPNAGFVQESLADYRARVNANVIEPIQTANSAIAGVGVGVATAGMVTLAAPATVSVLTWLGLSETAAAATVTTGLGLLGTAGAFSGGYSIYNNASSQNWPGLAFDIGAFGGGLFVGISGGGRTLAGLGGTPSSVPPGAGLFGDTSLRFKLNYPDGSFLGWLGSAPTPQSGGAVLTFAGGGAGYLFGPCRGSDDE